MESNKVEAYKMKLMAENKLQEKDYFGAKEFAMGAQDLYPQLDGIAQLLATIEVYVLAEKKIAEDIDWYGILGVNPLDDEEVIKKQYKRLALMLHPDKNRSVGANGAFQLIQGAWGLISDKAKRSEYDSKRANLIIQQDIPMNASDQPAQSSMVNQFYDFMGTSTTPADKGQTQSAQASSTAPSSSTSVPTGRARKPKAPRGARKPAPSHSSNLNPDSVNGQTGAPGSNDQELSTFWTCCEHCNMFYEHTLMYLDQNLRCPKCKEVYLANMVNIPLNNGFHPWTSNSIWGKKRSKVNVDSSKDEDFNPNIDATSRSEGGSASPGISRPGNHQQNPHYKRTSRGNTSAQTCNDSRTNVAGDFVFTNCQSDPLYGRTTVNSIPAQRTGASQADASASGYGKYQQGHSYRQTSIPGGFMFENNQQGWFPETANIGGVSGHAPTVGQGGQSFYGPNYWQSPLFAATNVEGGKNPSSWGNTSNVAQQEHEQSKRPHPDESYVSVEGRETTKKGKQTDDTIRREINLNMPPGDEDF